MKIHLNKLTTESAFSSDKFLITSIKKNEATVQIKDLTIKNRFQKFFSDLFGTQLRKISKVLNTEEGQKALKENKTDPLTQNISAINAKIAKINKRLLYGKIKTIKIPQAEPVNLSASDKLLLDFFHETGKIHAGDAKGRTIQDVWNFSRDEKEAKHNYIQWLFPLRDPTGSNPTVPLLNDKIIAMMQKDPVVKENLRKSLNSMLNFYGLKWKDASHRELIQDRSFEQKALNPNDGWLSVEHHNFLRLTRMMKCMTIFKLDEETRALQNCLLTIAKEYPQYVPKSTMDYWKF